MTIDYAERFRKSYDDAPVYIQRAFDRKSELLVRSLRHPSLHAKKYDEANDVWQARVNDDWRFFFRIKGDIYYMIDIMLHPK